MDIGTHIMLSLSPLFIYFHWKGYFFKEKKGWVFAVLFTGIGPDFDAFLTPFAFIFPALSFLGHRQASHSLIGAPLFGYLVFLIFRRLLNRFYFKEEDEKLEFSLNKETFPWIIYAGWTHSFLDVITPRGITIFFPFIQSRFAWGVLHFLSVHFILTSFLGVISLYYWRKTKKAHIVSKTYLTFFILFFLMAIILSGQAKNIAQTKYHVPTVKMSPIATTNPFNWYIYWQTNNNGINKFYLAYIELFRSQSDKIRYYKEYDKYMINNRSVNENNVLLNKLLTSISQDAKIIDEQNYHLILHYHFIFSHNDTNVDYYNLTLIRPRYYAISSRQNSRFSRRLLGPFPVNH